MCLWICSRQEIENWYHLELFFVGKLVITLSYMRDEVSKM